MHRGTSTICCLHRPSERDAKLRLLSIPDSEKQHCVSYPNWSNMTWNERLAVATVGPAHASSSPQPSVSFESLGVPVGAIARVTKISDTSMPGERSGVLYATMVVGLQTDISEAGELGDDGRLGVLMDGPPEEVLLYGQSKLLDVRSRFIECVLPLHCVQPIAITTEADSEGGANIEEGVPPV